MGVWARSGSIAGSLLLALPALATLPGAAHAWTETRIETAAAQVDATSDHARVSLELGVRVDGGWLTRLELRGLEPDLVLDPSTPPSFVCEDGRALAPTVKRVKDGQITLVFPDQRSAPRRGRHRLTLVYQAPLATAGAAGRTPLALWGLPPFVHDLLAARIELRAPSGSRPVQREHESPGTIEVRERGAFATITLEAKHVPRGIPLELAFSRPEPTKLAALPARSSASVTASTIELATAAACVLLLCLLKRRAVRRLAAEHGARVLALWPMPSVVHRGVVIALLAAFAGGYARAPEAALVALVLAVASSLDRGFARARKTFAVPWPRGAAVAVAIGRAHRARASRLFGGRAWLDATTPAGAALLVSAYAIAVARAVLTGAADLWLEALLAATPLFITATRLQLPPSRHDALIAHLRAARALRQRRRSRTPLGSEAPPAETSEAPAAPAAAAAAAVPNCPADAGPRAPDRAA